MANKFSNLFVVGGIALASLSNCLFVVDPGEKALIMNQISGLKKTVYNQGYNFKLPFVEVTILKHSLPSFTMLGWNQSMFTWRQEQRISKLYQFRWGYCSNLFLKSYQKFINLWEETTKKRYSTLSVNKFLEQSLLSVNHQDISDDSDQLLKSRETISR